MYLHWYLSQWGKFITPFLHMNPHARLGLADTIMADWTPAEPEKTQPPRLFCNGCRNRHISSNISMTRTFCLWVENDFEECHKCRFLGSNWKPLTPELFYQELASLPCQIKYRKFISFLKELLQMPAQRSRFQVLDHKIMMALIPVFIFTVML